MQKFQNEALTSYSNTYYSTLSMNSLAVMFRFLSLLSLGGLAAFLWFQLDISTHQNHSFLDEVVSDAYSILQSEKEAQWKDVSSKKTSFYDVFDTNEQIAQDDENPLEQKVMELRASEDALLRNPDYRGSLDDLALEFGVEALLWDSDSKQWKSNPSVKLEAPTGLRDPFEDESKYPKHDTKKEDGTVIKGVSRSNRLRTVLGMFYQDRHDKFAEISKLRNMVVLRDQELREYQNLFAKEKELKENLEDQLADVTIKLKGEQGDSDLEKKERMAEQEASEQQVGVLNDRVASLEQDKINQKKLFEAERNALLDEHKLAIKEKNEEIRLADASGYKRGVDEMIAKQKGGEVDEEEYSQDMNPFMAKKSGPPLASTAQLIQASQMNVIPDIGAPSKIARIDSRSGMLLLPVGTERGVTSGSVFTIWKDKNEAARIRVQSSRDGYSLGHILPRFGEPDVLRPGDSVYIVPENEETL